MATPSSDNPNTTSGASKASTSSLSYPLNEKLLRSMILSFVKYDRKSPNKAPTETGTSIIQLPLPVSVPDSIQIKSETYDFGALGNDPSGAIEQMRSMGFSGAREAVAGALGDADSVSAARALALMPDFGDMPIIGGKQQAARIFGGVVKNPHTTTYFDGISLRSFSFNWVFNPRSLQESQALHNIIETIKFNSRPAEYLQGYALDYPDLVYVSWQGDVEAYLPKIYKSFVSSVNVSVSGGSGMSWFTSGAPVEVSLDIVLNEINIVTRDVMQGKEPGQNGIVGGLLPSTSKVLGNAGTAIAAGTVGVVEGIFGGIVPGVSRGN